MERCFALVLVTLISGICGYSQQNIDRSNLWSEELNFLAEFPATPKESAVKLDTRFGPAWGKSWKLERGETTFEISVVHFSEPPIEMKMKSLQAFYKALCGDMIGAPRGYGDNFLKEEGMLCEKGVEKGRDLYLRLFLIRNRLYLAKVISEIPTQNAAKRQAEATHFLNSLHLAYIDPASKKLVFGMPKTFSQNLDLR